MVDHIDPYVPAYKIGSGDITWHDILKYISKKKKTRDTSIRRIQFERS